jgi:hypothetical protein
VIGMSSTAFTLANLERVLEEADFFLAAGGSDVAPELAKASEFLGLPHRPLFFVRVQEPGDDLLRFSCKVMETVWGAFGRVAMEFRGFTDGDPLVVVVAELETKL